MSGLTRREMAALGAAAAMSPLLHTRTLAAPPAAPRPEDLLDHVDPELRPAAREFLEMVKNYPPLSKAGIAAMRGVSAGWGKPPSPDVPVTRQRIAGKKGEPEVLVYIVNAKPDAARAGVLHTHGGGFILGTAAAGINELQTLASDIDAVIVTVEYRLAPEATYAGSIEDNYAALKWMYAHAAEIGVDRRKIAVAGESAGGGHAALLAITARDRGEVPIMFQSLVYPMLDDRTGSTRRVVPHIGTLVWTPALNRLGWESFLGQRPGTPSVPAKAVPARTANLAGLPPAWIGVGSIDLFVEEDIEYAERLVRAGTPTELLVVPGAFHGFDVMAPDSTPAKRFTAARVDALRCAFANVRTA